MFVKEDQVADDMGRAKKDSLFWDKEWEKEGGSFHAICSI